MDKRTQGDKTTNSRNMCLVQDEEVQISATLRNNFAFDLEAVSFVLLYLQFWDIPHELEQREFLLK
jgi:hypothetical protein